MTKMIFSTIIAMFLVVSSNFAQERNRPAPPVQRSPEEMASMRSEALKKQLDLSQDQTKSVHDLYLNQFTESRKLMENTRDRSERPTAQERQDRIKKQQDLTTQTNNKIREVLNETQLQKFEEYLKKQAEPRTQNSRRGPRG